MTSYKFLSSIAYNDPKYADIDFRKKNMFIYLVGDILASCARLPFETRKQLV
jgi:hypothetical protein